MYPRQVGKTTLLKIVIHKKLLAENDPRNILYLACDEFVDYKELGEALDDFLRARRVAEAERLFLFLDEVTFVDEWWRAVKSRINDGSFKNCVLVVTGSASMELLKQRERFAGRRGEGRDVVVMPLDFNTYLEKVANLTLTTTRSIDKAIEAMEANKIFKQKIKQHFLTYLNTGGYPPAIQEMHKHGSATYAARRIFLDGVRSDWIRVGKSEAYMKEILSYIINARGTPISWLSIAKNTSVNSPNTARSYVETLENLMTVLVLHYIAPSGEVLYRKNKKIHFVDPFIYRVFADYCGAEADEPALVEGVAAAHLSRRFGVYYWRDGAEVDCVVKHDGTFTGFEVKWGFGRVSPPRWLRKMTLLDEENLPLFLASVSFGR